MEYYLHALARLLYKYIVIACSYFTDTVFYTIDLRIMIGCVDMLIYKNILYLVHVSEGETISNTSDASWSATYTIS